MTFGADGSKRFTVSISHDSKISTDFLQAVVARGIAGVGLDVFFLICFEQKYIFFYVLFLFCFFLFFSLLEENY